VASGSASDSLNCAVSGASSGRGEGRKIKDALLVRETAEQVDDFAGRVKAKRVEAAPRHHDVLSCGKAERWRLPDGRWSPIWRRDAQAVRSGAGDSSEWRFCRSRFLRRGNPACGLQTSLPATAFLVHLLLRGSLAFRWRTVGCSYKFMTKGVAGRHPIEPGLIRPAYDSTGLPGGR
jgi:hypothetical protein